MRERIDTSANKIVTILCSRRLGKSFLLTTMAIEQCLKQPNSVVKYVCPKKKMVKTIIAPMLREITKDCPPELRPEFKTNDCLYLFPNGSQIQFAGSDNGHADTVRGGFAHLCIVDEAGFVDDLDYVIKEVLAPTTDTTRGRVILSSTPSKDPNHDFLVKFVMPAEATGELIKFVIYDNPMLTDADKQEIVNRYTLKEADPGFRREYMCEVLKDEDRSVIPEFDEAMAKALTKEWEKPGRYKAYVSMDIGFKDFTVALFAYYDFRNAKLVIEDELVLNGNEVLSTELCAAIQKKEAELFFDMPVKRIADNNNLILLNDIRNKTGMVFLPTAKDNKDAVINKLREMLNNGQIIFSPKCKVTIAHLKYAIWNKTRTQYARMAGYGHFDAVDSLLYLIRNVDYNHNPYPPTYGSNDWTHKREPKENNAMEAFKRMFKVNK